MAAPTLVMRNVRAVPSQPGARVGLRGVDHDHGMRHAHVQLDIPRKLRAETFRNGLPVEAGVGVIERQLERALGERDRDRWRTRRYRDRDRPWPRASARATRPAKAPAIPASGRVQRCRTCGEGPDQPWPVWAAAQPAMLLEFTGQRVQRAQPHEPAIELLHCIEERAPRVLRPRRCPRAGRTTGIAPSVDAHDDRAQPGQRGLRHRTDRRRPTHACRRRTPSPDSRRPMSP